MLGSGESTTLNGDVKSVAVACLAHRLLTDEGVERGVLVVRELLVAGLRLAALERGVVIHARDLGKLKAWAQAVAAAIGGFALAGAWSTTPAWWALMVALVLTWVSGFDYARAAPGLLRGNALA